MRSRLIGLIALLSIVAACDATRSSKTQAQLVVTGSQLIAGLGNTSQLNAIAVFSDQSQENVTTLAQWSSSNDAIATVTSGGLVTSVAPGSAIVTATRGSFSGHLTVVVNALQSVPSRPTKLTLTSSLDFSAVGEIHQLTVAGQFSDGSTADVTSQIQSWSCYQPSVVEFLGQGRVRTTALGTCELLVRYDQDPNFGPVTGGWITVTPPGTLAVRGRPRLPGHGGASDFGVPGFTVMSVATGDSTVTDSWGHFTLGGLPRESELLFEKTGYEPAQIVLHRGGGAFDVAVQQQIRIVAGQSATTTVFPHDMVYDPSPSFHCSNCRLIRVTAPQSGTLTVHLTWDTPNAAAQLFVNGNVLSSASASTLAASVPVDAGETIIYAQITAGVQLTLTISTSFAASSPPQRN